MNLDLTLQTRTRLTRAELDAVIATCALRLEEIRPCVWNLGDPELERALVKLKRMRENFASRTQ